MFKAYILIYGLIALVPHKDLTGKVTSLTALVLDTPSGTTFSWGAPFPAHHSERSIYFVTTPDPVLSLSGEQIRITVPAAVSPGEISMPANLRALSVGKVFESAGYSPAQVPKLRPECRSINPQNPCKDARGKNLLAGTVEINGDWVVSAVEVNYANEIVPNVVDASQYSFLTVDPPPGTLIQSKTQIAGGLLLEATLSKESDLVYEEGNNSYALKKGVCPFFGGTSQCIFVTVGNHPSVPKLCKDVTEYDRTDHHFDRVFELLDYSASPQTLPRRFLPYVLSRDEVTVKKLCPGGDFGDPPAIKCPSAFIDR